MTSKPNSTRSFYRRRGKRALDVTVASVSILVLCPVLVIIGLLVRLTMGSPVLFRQQRPGLHGRPFEILKFRTMSVAYAHGGGLKPDAERLSRFGKFLRATSLDELPELLNVVKGDMSLVGPRPLLIKYLELYSSFQMRRHEMRPGITGWAQINGRNTLTWDQKFALDVYYVEHASLAFDLRIVLSTILRVVTREGISQPGHATMEEFTGSAHGLHES